jgi:hypothetical protein
MFPAVVVIVTGVGLVTVTSTFTRAIACLMTQICSMFQAVVVVVTGVVLVTVTSTFTRAAASLHLLMTQTWTPWSAVPSPPNPNGPEGRPIIGESSLIFRAV